RKPIQQLIFNNSQQRRIIPVFWAQHDDFAYIGRPYQPFQKLASRFKSLNIADFGIIHWTTRPLDIYFKNTMEQLWSNTADQALIKTAGRYCNAVFGAQSKNFYNYINEWLKEAPIFGRETTNYFITKTLKTAQEVIKQSAFRYTLLQSIDATRLTPKVSNVVSYYKHYEKFIQSYHLANMRFDSSVTLLRNNQVEKAKQIMSGNLAKESILHFSQAIKYNGPDKGEMGLLVSLNTRWYPYILAQQQLLGLAPVSYIFNQTVHESLAQEGGSFTFAFDKHGLLSKVLGEQETGLTYFEGNGVSGLKSDSLFTFNIKTISGKPISSGTGYIEVNFSIDQTGSASIADSIPVVFEITNSGKIISRKTYSPRSKDGIQKLVLPVSFQNKSDPKTDLLIHPGAYKILLNGISFQPDK
ncbi:MAG: hypothetical protein H7Z13_18460, partial [Ferruginibacter sp.]|nr:hypothetical protein [Ferruginibacter sp.]